MIIQLIHVYIPLIMIKIVEVAVIFASYDSNYKWNFYNRPIGTGNVCNPRGEQLPHHTKAPVCNGFTSFNCSAPILFIFMPLFHFHSLRRAAIHVISLHFFFTSLQNFSFSFSFSFSTVATQFTSLLLAGLKLKVEVEV
jgi:hypothetical protein